MLNLAKATLGIAGALFSDPSCAVCCLSPGENATGSLLLLFSFTSGEKDGNGTHQATCQQMKWLHDYVVELSTSARSALKNLALLCGQQMKAVTGLKYICWLIGAFLNWTFAMTKL